MSISRVSLYHLETLLWIDRLGTFSAAAERLNTTQPAVSARMRELEQRLGTRLFRRDGRTMSLTAAGRKLVRDCDPLLRDMQVALLGSGGFAEASGVVRIGAGEIAAASCLPAFVADLKADMPNVGLEIEIDLTANLIQQLLTGRTDIAFAAGPIAHPALKTQPIGEVALMWLASPAVAAAFAAGEAQLPVWSLASHSPIHGRMRDAIEASRIAQESLNLCNNARTMIDIAKAGGGVGIFPEPMARAEVAAGALVELSDMPVLAPVAFHVAMRVSDSEPVLARIFERSALLSLSVPPQF
ncbi:MULTISPECIES: LysR family transcriptional regulator [unclassified Sphingopyxis]|uniref:LysR family transcriptional regulator n=1 Tax=unclassified Sphingopyxis TaxID=2614943 RepID=UPI0007309934|nr:MULTISPECIES: LysR family transcriptional regulator [unclassified Sphingopyxis]KTE28077.1 LysR family transcriptional regulator [Sphingopyxis sp. H057]KTE55543.1 LysR family transcriptional regulator [Sphingopyxis sp. H073]KTE57573.1 LysR family transcriptional regulator [Sphingopyxis sp. H071]KTE57980.1 LysR family transcriptional regulator [Sphingopyxis sp. H107]KTE66430.1 LysR family transcriptional regulator [Sphingopyxis sp. H100]